VAHGEALRPEQDRRVFESDEAISFQPRGTDFLGDAMELVSDEHAYYFDAPNTQLIRWNPKSMTIEGEIDRSVTFKEDLTTIYDTAPPASVSCDCVPRQACTRQRRMSVVALLKTWRVRVALLPSSAR
jgi:hypothetical protein